MDSTKYLTVNVIDPEGVVAVYRDHWWWCVDGDPTKALFYRGHWRIGTPQCNSNKKVSEMIGAKLGYHEFASLIQIPLAFVPYEDHDVAR